MNEWTSNCLNKIFYFLNYAKTIKKNIFIFPLYVWMHEYKQEQKQEEKNRQTMH